VPGVQIHRPRVGSELSRKHGLDLRAVTPDAHPARAFPRSRDSSEPYRLRKACHGRWQQPPEELYAPPGNRSALAEQTEREARLLVGLRQNRSTSLLQNAEPGELSRLSRDVNVTDSALCSEEVLACDGDVVDRHLEP